MSVFNIAAKPSVRGRALENGGYIPRIVFTNNRINWL